MAQIAYRANLASKGFPFNSQFRGSTIVVPGQDQVYTRYGSTPERLQDINTPQVYYMHNFLPTMEGYSGIAWSYISALDYLGQQIDTRPYGVVGVNYKFSQALPVSKDNSKNFLCSDPASTSFYYIPEFGGGPTLVTGTAATRTAGTKLISTGKVNGRSFVYDYELGGGTNQLGEWTATGTLNTAVAAGLSLVTTVGILSSFGYLVAFSKNSVAWSSTTDPLDFVPSLITGAGGGTIQEIKGDIKFGSPTSFGFILYCDKNAISAVYTGNSRSPFKFTEIKGAGGWSGVISVAENSDFNGQYARTSVGIQLLKPDHAESVFPEVDAAPYFTEYYDTATKSIKKPTLNTGSSIAGVSFIANRYLVFSYADLDPAMLPALNLSIYGYANIYDMVLQRWGKVRIQHNLVLEGTGGSIGFLSGPGVLWFAQPFTEFLGTFDPLTYRPIDCVMLFGKYKYVRSRRLVIDEATLELQENSRSAINLSSIATIDGRTFSSPVAGYLNTNSAGLKQYLMSTEGENISLLLEGWCNLVSLNLKFHLGGNI